MRIHKEGYISVLLTGLLVAAISVTSFHFVDPIWIAIIITVILLFVLLFIIHFFRIPPTRLPEKNSPGQILSPCDGKVVAIEKITETEFFKDERIQVSVFMSPLNVHINWYPSGGRVVYSRYYKGKHLVAWHPKSSMLNEHATVAIKTAGNKEIVVRQIAGAIARRIVTYSQPGQKVKQGDDLGFIKFGSRVDVFLPTDAKISVALHQKVKGNITGIAII